MSIQVARRFVLVEAMRHAISEVATLEAIASRLASRDPRTACEAVCSSLSRLAIIYMVITSGVFPCISDSISSLQRNSKLLYSPKLPESQPAKRTTIHSGASELNSMQGHEVHVWLTAESVRTGVLLGGYVKGPALKLKLSLQRNDS